MSVLNHVTSEVGRTLCGNCNKPYNCHGVLSEKCPNTETHYRAAAQPTTAIVPVTTEHHGGLPNDAKARKTYPIFTGLLAYFPDALAETSHVSHVGNEQHNPGEPLRWAQEKSQDELDAMMRHLTDEAKGVERDTDGQYHLAKVIWRASAALQRKIEAKRRGMTVTQYNESCRDMAGKGRS